jgi:hypothetical protein
MDDPPPKRRARSRAAARVEPTVTSVPHLRDGGDGRPHGRFRILRTLVHRPLRTLVGLACGAIFVSFVSNLLFMQEGPHPAPLFAKQEAPRPDAARNTQTAAAPTAPETAPRSATTSANSPAQQTASRAPASAPASETVAPLPPAAPRSAPISIVAAPPARAPEPAKPVAKQPDFDPIAQFLRTGVAQAPATTASTAAPASADSKRIAAAQRALGKLGHALDADGLMGPGTRAAIQRFERDANLPVTGELNPRTVKALSARASIPIP